EPGSRARELDRVSWSLAGVDRNVYINKKQAQLDENAEQNNVDVPLNPLVVGMDAYIQAFIENKVPADYLDGMPNRNTVIRDWILANLFMPHTVYADIASVGGLDQELMLSQLSQDVPVDMTVDFVPGEGLVIHFNRAFIPRDQDQNVLVDEKHYPSLTVKMTANISAQDPNGAHYKLQYSSQLDPVLSKAVGERAKLASLRLKPHSYSYVTPASDRAVAALPQQNQNGEQDQVHYYALMSYRDVLNKPANERQTKLSELQPQLENITLSSPPILQTVKRNFELEKHFVDLQVRVDQTEETLKAYLEQIKGITDDDFKDDHGVVSYDLSRLSNKQQKDPKVYSAVLALGMIQKFKQQASTPVIKDYRAMLMALDGVLIRNNNKKHWWQGNRFSDGFGYKSLANGETKIVALKNNKAALEARGYTVVAGVNAALDRQSRYAGTFASDVAFELKAFEQAQHKIHQDAKSFIFSSDLDPKKSVLGRLSTDGNVVRARRHVHDLARALVNAKDTAALAVVKQRVDAIYGEAALADASEEVQALRQAYSKHDVERGADKLYLENITAVIKAKFTAIEKINSPDQGAVLDRSYLSDVFNVFSHAVDAAFEKMKPGNSVYEVDAPAFDEIAAGAYKALNAVLDQRDAILDAVKAQYQSTLNTIVETAKAAIADKDPAEVVETIAAAETEIGEVASPADLDQGDKAKLISDSQSQLAIMKKDRLVAILKNKVETIKQQLVTNISDLVSAQQLGDLEAYRQKALLDIDQFAFIESGLTPAVAEKVIAPFRQAISAAVKEKREAIIREPQPVPEEWQSSVEVPGGLKALYTVFENAVISRHTESKSSEQELLAIYNDRVKAFYPNPRDSDAVSKEVKSVISKANLKKFDRGYEERKGQHSFGAEERDLRLVKREQSEASRRPRSVSLSESHFGLLANANKGLELSASKDDLELLPRTRPVLPTR
ncbi:MAG: hypothetical protein KDH94_01195, partial [Coxiellaceae bacterium]|nr:hypothetical protein [Coxiellaceae bacterium]